MSTRHKTMVCHGSFYNLDLVGQIGCIFPWGEANDNFVAVFVVIGCFICYDLVLI